MRSTTLKITDYNIGSAARTMIEAPSQEIDELYQQMLNGLLEAIQVSVYTSFNFPALPTVSASGLIRVTIAVQSTAVLIPANTSIITADGSQTYLATSDLSIPGGASFGDIPVVAQVPGLAGNQAAMGSFTSNATIPGLVSLTNLAPFVNGAPAELPSAQKVRFNAYVQTLSRGTIAALQYALTRLTFISDVLGNVLERVATAAIFEPYLSDPAQSPGLVVAYIHNGVGGTSPALVAQALAILNGFEDANGNAVPGYKAAGVVLKVFSATEITVPVTGMLTIGPGYNQQSVVAQVTSAIYTYIAAIAVGQPYLGAVANDLVMDIAGVTNWVPVTPLSYVPAAFNVKLMPGAFQILGWLASRTYVRTVTTGVLA